MADAVAINGHGNQYIQDGYKEYNGADGRRAILHDYVEGEFIPSEEQFREEIREEVAEIVKQQMKLKASVEASSLSETTSSRSRGSPGNKTVIPIADIRGADTLNYRKGEKVLRCKLASCYRLIDVCALSSGTHSYITARLGSDQLLIAPYGLLYDEVTASSLVKVDIDGNVVDGGSTSLGACHDEVSLHSAVYAARDNIKCIVHITSPSATMVSIMKTGLLSLCHESMVLGEVTYCDYFGSGLDEQEELREALGPSSQVMFLRNFGVVVVGEAVEETYRVASNVMTATDAQVNLIAIGVENLHLPSAQTIETAYNTERDLPPGVDQNRRWKYGEVEFEGLMRRLDNDGYCTGYVYRDTLGLNRKRSTSVIDNRGKLSVYDERASGIASPLNQLLQRGKSPDWVISPNVYVRKDEGVDETMSRSGTLGRSDSKGKRLSHWVSADNVLNKPKQRSVSMKVIGANRFAPQGANPKELRDKVKEIRKEYFDDTITAGPQSTVLEGVTWEEAQRIREGQPLNGVDNVRVTAASRGIIQRDHQQDAIFYKKFILTNPFENITEKDLEKYRRDVQKKAKKGYGGYAESEPELLSEHRRGSPVRCSTPPAKPARSMSPDQQEVQQPVAPVRGQLHRAATDIDEPEVRAAVRPVLTAAQQPNTQQQQQQQKQLSEDKLINKAPTISSVESPATSVPSGDRDYPQRSHSARLPAEKRPEPSTRSVLLDAPTPTGQSATLDTRGNKEGGRNLSAGHAATLDARSSKENSPAKDVGEDGKVKKKKRGLFSSFSKKKKVPTATLR